MKTTTLIITAHYYDCFDNPEAHTVEVSTEQYDATYEAEAAYRWGSTSYMTSLEDETCARLTGTGVCNCTYTIRRKHKFTKYPF